MEKGSGECLRRTCTSAIWPVPAPAKRIRSPTGTQSLSCKQFQDVFQIVKFLKVCSPGGLGTRQARYPSSRCRQQSLFRLCGGQPRFAGSISGWPRVAAWGAARLVLLSYTKTIPLSILLMMCIYIYIYIYVYIYIYIYMYTPICCSFIYSISCLYIYIQRERERFINLCIIIISIIVMICQPSGRQPRVHVPPPAPRAVAQRGKIMR